MSYEDQSADNGASFLDGMAAERPQKSVREPQSHVISLDIGELLSRTFPPQEPLLGPWLRKQTLAMVHAWRGIGKTHFGLGLAYAVASGGTFLKWNAEQPRKVLYIDGEMSGAAIQERLAAIVAANSRVQPSPGYFRIVTPDAQEAALP